MRDPLHPKWHGLPVEKQHTWVHVHRNRLSAIPQHLHLETFKKKKKAFHRVTDENFLCSYAASPLQFTWKELTGKGLAEVLTGVAFGGVGSGGGGFCCTARLWLVTASCKAFNTCKVRKNINWDSLHRCQSLVLLFSIDTSVFDKCNIPFSPAKKGGWPMLKSYTTSCPFPSLDPVSENGSNKLWIVTNGCQTGIFESRRLLNQTCPLLCVKEQLGWSKTLASVSRLDSVRSISLHQYILFW